MAVTQGGNIFIFEQDYGFNYRGAWTTTDTYSQGDIVYYGTPQTAYLATTSISANIIPTTQNTGWARLAERATAGTDGEDGNYNILLFARSDTEPRAPNSTDAVFPANPADFSSTVWTRGIIPSGTDPLWLSFITVNIATSSLVFGQVARLSGEEGIDGLSIDIEFSPNGTTNWSTTARTTDEYVRFRRGSSNPWSTAIEIKGNPGIPGNSAEIQFSPNGTSSWTTTPRSNTEYIRFRVGSTDPWTSGIKIKGDPGEDGTGITFEFSPDNSTWHTGNPNSNDIYIRFREGTGTPTSGIKFVGDDGTDGDDSLEVQYASSNTPSLFHSNLQANDLFIRFRIGHTGPWTNGVRFVGRDGADAPNVIIQFSNIQNASRFTNNYVVGDVFIRFSNDNGVTWSPGDTGTRFVGGTGGAGADGESVSIEYSADGMAGWHGGSPVAADYFIRFQLGTRGWQTGLQFRAYPLMVQYSIDGTTLWHDTFVDGTDKYIRFSNDNGVTWTAGDKFVGEDGDDTLELEYSDDNSTWSTTLAVTTRYIRFRVGGTGPWGTGIRFVGATGGFRTTLYQNFSTEQTTVTAPTNLQYNWTTSTYVNLGSDWLTAVPSTTNWLYKLDIFVPPELTTNIVDVTLLGSAYTDHGNDGTDGASYSLIYRRTTSTLTRSPFTTGITATNGVLNNAPADWSLTAPTTGGTLWACVSSISPTGTISFSIPFRVAAANGSSIDVVYRRSANNIAGDAPCGVGIFATNGELNTAPSNWTLFQTGGSNPQWISIATIPGTESGISGSNTANPGDPLITFSLPLRVEASRANLVQLIYQRSSTIPTQPARRSGDWNGSNFTPPAGWHITVPTGTDLLYACVVNLYPSVPTTSGIVYNRVFQLSGDDGDSFDIIYQRNADTPTQPTDGTGTWNGTDYDPPSSWHESEPAGDDPLYGCLVSLSGTDRTASGITYHAFYRITPRDGRDAPGIGANVEEAEFAFVYDTTDRTVTSTRPNSNSATPWVRGYDPNNITDFTGGVAGLATQDATGIIIPQAGIYSIAVQIDLHLMQTTPSALWGLILHIENSDGTLIHDFILKTEGIEDPIPAGGEILPAYGATPPISLPAGSKAYLRFFYQRLFRSGSSLSQDFNYRVVEAVAPDDDDDRIVVRRYTASNQGGSGTGTGSNGNSIDVVYRRSSTVLTTPPVGGTALNGELRTAPQDWSISIPSGTDPIYTAFAHINGVTNSIAYDEPVQWTGDNGSAIGIIYRRSSTVLTTAPPNTGITQTDGVLDNVPTGWSRAIPTGTGSLYGSIYSITAAGVITFDTPTLLQATDGDDGSSVSIIYRRGTHIPSLPTAGAWNGTVFTPPADWDLAIPTGTDDLYASNVRLSGTDQTNTGITYSSVYRLTPRDGSDGIANIPPTIDEAVFRLNADRSNQFITFTRSTTGHEWPTNLSRVVGDFTGSFPGLAAYSRNGIFINRTGIYSFNVRFYIDIVTGIPTQGTAEIWIITPGGSLQERYSIDGDDILNTSKLYDIHTPPVRIFSGSRIQVYIRPHVAPNSQPSALQQQASYRVTSPSALHTGFTLRRYSIGAGNSIDIVYRRSSTTLSTAPTGGTATEGRLTAAPTDWSLTVPSGTDDVYFSIAQISGVNNNITYGRPIKSAGNNGLNGSAIGVIYRRSSGVLTTAPSNTGITQTNGALNNIPTDWSRTVPTGTTSLYGSIYSITSAGVITFAPPTLFSAINGTDGNNGRSIAVVYRRETSVPSLPTGGTWNGNDYDPPSGWHESPPSGTTTLYASVVRLSGTDETNTGITYDPVIRLTGNTGEQGNDGKFEIGVYLWSVNEPPDPTPGRWDGNIVHGIGDWSRDPVTSGTTGQRLWRANILVDPADTTTTELVNVLPWSGPKGEDSTTPGIKGDDGGSIDVIYQRNSSAPTQPTDGTGTWNGSDYDPPSGWHESEPIGTDTLYGCLVRLSGTDQTASGITYDGFYRITPIDGTTGANGISLIEIYQRGATIPSAPTLTYNGTTFGGFGSWSRTIPATPSNQNLWAMTATYREQVSGITLDPTAYLKGLATATPVVPPTTNSYVFTYGLATAANAPTGSPITLPAVQLAAGQSHTYSPITVPITTTVGVNYYVELPTGITMTSARDTFQGETINDWTTASISGGMRWFYAIGYANSQETFIFTIRRNP